MKLSNRAREVFDRLRNAPAADADPPAGADTAPSSGRDPVVRRMNFPFDADTVPRHWLGESMVGTALANALNLVFPDGERFFIRSVNYYLGDIDDPVLRDRIKRFYGQEGQHAREHERMFEILRDQGYDIDAFLVPYRKLAYAVIAPAVSPKLRLSVTAALEHYTATMAEFALEDPLLREHAAPVIAELLQWHAAEEIEHKDVAYEVMQRVDDSYALRVAGIGMASLVLLGFWAQAVVVLLRQEPEFAWGAAGKDLLAIRPHLSGLLRRLPGAVVQYLEPGFHPAKVGNDELALAYLESIGRRWA